MRSMSARSFGKCAANSNNLRDMITFQKPDGVIEFESGGVAGVLPGDILGNGSLVDGFSIGFAPSLKGSGFDCYAHGKLSVVIQSLGDFIASLGVGDEVGPVTLTFGKQGEGSQSPVGPDS